VGTRVFADGQVGGFEETGMSYPDFIFFMLSEEDKSSQVALRYWYVKTTDCLCDLLNVGGVCVLRVISIPCTAVHGELNIGVERLHVCNSAFTLRCPKLQRVARGRFRTLSGV
jgi:hypothetical protein